MSDYQTYTPPNEPEQPFQPETPVDPAPSFVDPGITSDDKLWAMLSYILTPIVPAILLLLDEKKKRPFIRAHAPQALAFGIVYGILAALLAPLFLIGCLVGLAGFVLAIIWGIKANKGEYITIPFLTDFIKQQGWA
ncbi:MAG: DUF4870 domain-containing protein [Anaerolineaceae bacterium]|jgi:uncharacterized membrane protein